MHLQLPPRVRAVARWVPMVAAVTVPALTLPRIPSVSPWPVAAGLLPWMVGKYVLCPLRWHAISESGRGRAWHMRTYAEAELFGLLTPGHVGADVWRTRRLHKNGMATTSAAAEVGLDRLIGAIGLCIFVLLAGATLPLRVLAAAVGIALLVVTVALAIRRIRPDLVPHRRLPRPAKLAHGIALSVGYQLTICALLFGTVAATGYVLAPLTLIAALGASQVAAIVPGMNGASPRDGALVLGLVAAGLPWSAALGAVVLKASVAWLPALLIGGVSLLVAKFAHRPAAALA